MKHFLLNFILLISAVLSLSSCGIVTRVARLPVTIFTEAEMPADAQGEVFTAFSGQSLQGE